MINMKMDILLLVPGLSSLWVCSSNRLWLVAHRIKHQGLVIFTVTCNMRQEFSPECDHHLNTSQQGCGKSVTSPLANSSRPLESWTSFYV